MIFYFTGTGNSEWLAREVASRCKDCLVNIGEATVSNHFEYTLSDNERVGFVFPVYGWNMPGVVCRFIERLQLINYKGNYVYFAVTYGDDMGTTHQEVCQLLATKNWQVSSSFAVQMPNTYVCLPGFDIDAESLQQQKLYHARTLALQISEWVLDRRSGKHLQHPGSFPWIKTHVLGTVFHRYLIRPNYFSASDACIGCGRCAQGCFLHNIEMQHGRPYWSQNCAMCLRCYHQCPQHAVQYGKYTTHKGQYLMPLLKRSVKTVLLPLLLLLDSMPMYADGKVTVPDNTHKTLSAPLTESSVGPDRMVSSCVSHTNLSAVQEASFQVDKAFLLREGIDVSHYQRTIDWQAVAAEGTIGYAYMKATEGASLVDETYQYNIMEAHRCGLKVGSYHFFRSNASVEDQLNNFLSVVKRNQQDLLPIVDVEKINEVNHEVFVKMLHEFLDGVTRKFGRKPVLYTFVNFYNHYLKGQGFDDYPLMIAFYRQPQPLLSDERPYIIWQYSASGTIPGIKGRVDRSCVMDGFSLMDIAF